MRVVPTLAALLALGIVEVAGCAGRTETEGAGGSAAGGAGGASASGGAGGASGGGDPCRTHEGVRLCGGSAASCGWVGPDECPGGGCARPFDRLLGGDAVAGVCFSDLADNGNRACWGCKDGETCVERAPGELACVPESVCAGLWNLGAKGVCRYADLVAYDSRPLPVLSKCPKPKSALCGGPCPACAGIGEPPCTGRSPDHPQGFCTSFENWCALGDAGYLAKCHVGELCGVFHVPAADAPVARLYGRCLSPPQCEGLASDLPGGFDCYDESGKLVTGSTAN